MIQDFENRIRKMHKHYGKWARKKGIQAFRFYHKDIPGFPYTVEQYGDKFSVSEHFKAHISQEERKILNKHVSLSLSKVLEVPQQEIFFRQRFRQKGDVQYTRSEEESYFWIQEGGHQFRINLETYVDVGLFLDHRITRSLVEQESKGKSVLNLFCYTGSFSVYAAAGGAQKVTSVDLSNTYLDWAQENMKANGFTDSRYSYLREDVLQWLKNPPDNQFDLAVLDPPTFSNSKKMLSILDIDRDHLFLINQTLKTLKSGGILYFSNNYRKFSLREDEIIGAAEVKEITNQTIPQDFRNQKAHWSYKIIKS